MKIIYRLWLPALLLMLAAGCATDNVVSVYDPSQTVAARLRVTPEVVLLRGDAPDNIALLVSWDRAANPSGVAMLHTLELARAGAGFEGAASVVLPAEDAFYGLTHEAANDILLRLDLPPGVAADLELRIMAQVRTDISVSPGLEPSFSNVVMVKLTPFNAADALADGAR